MTTTPIAASEADWSYTTYSEEADASDVLLPLASFFLPGAGQWARSQAVSGAAYAGVAIGGLSYAVNASKDFGSDAISDPDLSAKNVALRKYMLGMQTYQASGGMSLYHTFRSAVWQRQKFGEYKFLNHGESPQEILSAPFRFEFVTRPSTWIPLSIGGLASWYLATHPDHGYHKAGFRREDPWFAGGFSYNAGTHEEAIFRGWLMPVVHESGLSPQMSNLSQATIFALAHLGSNPLPLPQFFLGLHLGNVTLRNGWNIS